MKFSPVNFIISLIVGWFVVSFLQAFVIAVSSGGWAGFYTHFQQIAFFQDGMGIIINAIAIVVFGAFGIIFWMGSQKKK